MSYNSRVELLREEIDKLTEKLKVSEEVRLAQAAHIVRLISESETKRSTPCRVCGEVEP